MNNVGEELGRYGKRFVQMIWDPIPRNDDSSPIWCLGTSYESMTTTRAEHEKHLFNGASSDLSITSESPVQQSGQKSTEESSSCDASFEQIPEQPRDRVMQADEGGGWPLDFLNDFEARLWFTYRSNFPPISKSQDPKALAAMSFTVRIKSQLNQGGFTSDTGWGCMIRSGQSMLGNALAILKLGRGKLSSVS
jgi:cysteine protease ATG4